MRSFLLGSRLILCVAAWALLTSYGGRAAAMLQPATTQPAKPATSQPATKPLPSDDDLEAAKKAALSGAAAPVKPSATSAKPDSKPPVAEVKPGLNGPRPPMPKPAHAEPQHPTSTVPPAATPPGSGKSEPPRPQMPGKPIVVGAKPTPIGGKPGQSPAGPAPANPATTDSGPPVTNTNTTMTFEMNPADPESRTYRFDYQATSWSDVLGDFSRMSGLSFLNQPDPPITETLTFRSPRTMTYREALHQLNELLLGRQVNKYLVQRQDNYLTINRLPDLMRNIPPEKLFKSFDDMEAAKLDPFDIVLVLMDIPQGWSGYDIIEEFRPVFSDTYGTQVKGDKLELTGLVQEHRRFREYVTKMVGLSGPPDNDPRPDLVSIPLKVTKASDIQNILRQIYPITAPGGVAAAARGAPGAVDPKADLARRIDITPDNKNNVLLVRAPARILNEMRQLIDKLDSGPGIAPTEMRSIKLQHADPNQLTMLLKQVFVKEQQDLIKDPTINVSPERKALSNRDVFADMANGGVVLMGTKEGVDAAERLVRDMDKPDENSVTQIVTLKHADSGAIATSLTQVFPPTPKPNQLPTRILPRTNDSLIVSCSKSDFEKVSDLIAKLDVENEDETKEHLVKLKAAAPSALSNILTQAATGLVPAKAPVPGRPQAPAGPVPGSSMKFIPDDASGYLIIYCSDKEWEKIGPLVTQLDDQTQIGEPKLVIIPLKNANPGDMVATLKTMFPPPPPAPGKPGGAPQASFFADGYNDTIQVYASAEFIKKVEPLIKQLDLESTGELHVMKLVHARADAIAPIITQAMATSAAPAAPPGAPPGAVRPATSGLRIVAEPITNSLLVTAPPKELAQIEKLVGDMEAKSETARVILEAKHRSTTELAEVLKSLVGGGAAPAMKAPGAPAGPASSLNILPNGKTLILDGPQEQVAKCIQLFEQLDVPYDQPLFRKYKVQDAEEDEKKLRSMLAMSPSSKSSAATPKSAPGQPGAAPAPSIAAASSTDTITIYADTYESALIVGVKSESEFAVVESCLRRMFSEPIVIKNPEGEPIIDDTSDFFLVPLKNKDAFDIAYDVERLLNPDGKSGGVRLDEGPSKKSLLVRNCKPAQRDKVMEYVKLYDIPSGRVRKGMKVIQPKLIPPNQLAKLIATRYEQTTGTKVKVVGLSDEGPVRTIDIHADEPDEPTTQPATRTSITPCVLPAALMDAIARVIPSQSVEQAAQPLHDPATCPVCRQNACALPGAVVASLDAVIQASFDDPVYDDPKPSKKDESDQPNHVLRPKSKEAPRTVDAAPEEQSSGVTVLPDAETGSMTIMGTDDEIEDIEDWIDDLINSDAPPTVVQFPLKYADVVTAGTLLEQVFNQGGISGKKGKGAQLSMMPQPMQQQAGKQPGPQGQPPQPGVPPQPGQQQQQQQLAQQQQQQAAGVIKAIPDQRTKCLLVVAPPQLIPLVVDVLKKIDQRVPPTSKNMRIFRLANLDATQVVQNLREVLGLDSAGGASRGRGGRPGQPGMPQGGGEQPQQQIIQMQGQPGQPGQPATGSSAVVSSDTVTLTADEQTNTIIAKAPTDTLDLIDNLIKELEKETNNTKPVMQRIALAHARAVDIATIGKEIAGQVTAGPGDAGGRGRGSRGSVSVNADARTNSVILAGTSKDVERVADVIKELDVDQQAAGIKQFVVKGDAASITNALKTVFNAGGRESDIVITADASSGTILVKAPPPQMEEISAQIATLDSKAIGQQELKLIRIKVADAEAVAKKLEEVFGGANKKGKGGQPLTIKGNKNSGTVYVANADADVFEQIKKVATDMDAQPSGMQVKSFQLKHASAVDINQKLTDMMAKATVTGGMEGVKLDLVGVVPDARTNSLIVTGGPVTFALIGKVLAEIDQEADDDAKITNITYTIPDLANAQQVATNITEMYKGQDPKTTGVIPPVVTANPDSNLLVVSANGKQHSDIKKSIIDPILGMTTGVKLKVTKFIQITNGKPEDMAKALTEAFQARTLPNNKGKYPVTITADSASNSLVVTATEEYLREVEEMVKKVDTEKGRKVFTVAMPELVPAKTVTENINKLYGPAQGKEGVKAEYHEPTNTLLVYATDLEYAKIKEQVIDVVSKSPATGIFQMYKIALKHANADEVAKTLQAFFDKKSGLKNQQSNNLPPWMRGAEPPAKAAENQVTITAEPSANMLLVYCTEKTKELIDDIIKDIDVDSSTRLCMELVALKYVDAQEMIAILTEYLKVSKRSGDEEGPKFMPWWADREVKKEDKAVLAGDMRLKAVESMNSVILVGKREAVDDAITKIKELDVERKEGTVDVPTRIALNHGNASDIAGTLNRVFNDPSRIDKSKGASYKAPVIVAEDGTNSIIVRASASDFGQIKAMIENLDAELKDEGGSGVRILPVPTGRNLDELAKLIETQLNETENNRKMIVKDYKPSLVKIGADLRAGALLVSGSKAKFDEAESLVKRLAGMGPAGGMVRKVIRLEGQLSPTQAKQLIEQVQQGPQSKPGSSGARGPRSDADWSNQRRYDRVRNTGTRPLVAMSFPVLMTQIALSAAVAQTSAAPPEKSASAPTVSTIRPRTTATTQPAQPPAVTKEQVMQKLASEGRLDMQQMTDAAKSAFQKKLSGAPVSASEVGQDALVIEGSEEDVEVITALLEMLDKAVPAKKIEYVTLKNARAQELAKTLTDVFGKLEKKGDRTPRAEDKVDVIADPRTNGLYIAATEDKMTQALDLIRKNEEAAPSIEKNVKSFQLRNRRVMEAGDILKKMVSAYLKQKGVTDITQIGIELDPQTNTILVTAGETDLAFVEKLVQSLDAEVPESTEEKQAVGEADVMIIPLRITQADTLGVLLSDLLKKAATGETPMKDFIRRFRLLDDKGEPLATVNLDKPIVIFGDKESNSLIIASSKKNCLIMKQVALAFDKEPARAEVVHKVYTLKWAESTEVADQLKKLLTDSESLTQRPGKGDKSGLPDGQAGALVYKAVVAADPRSNQVLVVGRPEELKILEDLITRLDVKGLDVMPFELVKLEYASAGSLETALTEMMKARADIIPKGTGPNAGKSETVIIKGEPRSRSLIISANASRREELKDLIKKLDIPSTALIEDIRTITLKKTTATDLADKLKKLWEQRQAQQAEGSKGLKLETPAIVADERSNSLIVAASKGDFDAIKSVVEKIEGLELNPMANIYIVRLKYNSAKGLEPAFTTLFEKRAEMRTIDGKIRPEDKVAIKVDEVTNAILFAGSRENYDVLMQKIKDLDQEIGVPALVEFFVCTNVGAGRVKDTIDQLFKDGVFKPGVTSDSATSKDRAKVTVTIDERSNVLIVSAAPENMELVREIYKRMNSVTTPWDVAITRLIIIEHGDSVKIAAQVQDYFEKLKKIREEESSSATKSKGGFGITVFADDRSNRIVLGGTKDGIDTAVELVKKLDVPPGTPGQIVEVYRLTEAPASRVGETIKKLFEERNKPRSGDTGTKVGNIPVSVEVEGTTNSLLVNASREDHILVKDLIKRLDRPSTVLEMARVIPLEKASSEKVKKILEDLYQSGSTSGSSSSSSSGSSSGGGGKGIGVMEDKRTNSVIVTAPPGEMENIIKLVERLDMAEVKGQAEIGVFPCNNEDASKMAELLNAILTGSAVASGGGSSSSRSSRSSSSSSSGGESKASEEARELQSMILSFASTDERGRETFLKTIRENVQITSNERTNSVIAIAPPQSLKLIKQLVKRLDEIQRRAVLVKVFLLHQADATKMVDQLEKMFALDEGQESEREFQQGREVTVEGGTTATGGAPVAGSQSGGVAKGTFGRPKTTFVADERTNAVIAAGWPEDLDVVADLIDQLDSRAIQERDNLVLALNNATAEDVESALKDYFEAENQRLQTLGDVISPQRRMDQEVSIVSHPESNQLIVSVSPRYKQQVLTLVEQLDRPPPQVMIQVMIAEVSLNDRFEMGLEFALQQLRFSETAVAGGNGVLQSTHFDVVGGTDLGAAGSGLGGFSFTLTGEDFNFLVRALQSDSRLEVIQRPMIMCQDNQEANISIGQSVPVPQGSVASGFGGGVTTTVQYQDVGVILTVEPHINPDGFVYLLVEPEISAVTDSTIQVAPGSFAPIINRRTASTNVAVKDGETVVIGGLITTTENESESKVPVLGDIPGLGILFRTTVRTKNKTELLIAMTPHVIRSVEDARRLSIEKRDESGIITDNQKQSPLMEKLRVTPESGDEINEIESPAVSEEPGEKPETTPAVPTRDESKPKYGPQAPRYGPLLPPSEDVVVRRDRDATPAWTAP